MDAIGPSLAYNYINHKNQLSDFSSSAAAQSLNLFFHSQRSISTPHTFKSLCYIRSSETRRRSRSLKPIHASSNTESISSDNQERWLLEPVGDGDTKHIGFNVPMPGAFEIASSVVTVGRLPEKADMVIPVATVSGVHARIKVKEGNLLVIDLDSTNGTFIDKKRLSPGVVAMVSPGNCLTFGDTSLAKFRVSKLKNVELPSKLEQEFEVKLDSDVPTENISETAS
ncbi:uncharacterized protein LOC113311074 [Papaver somniferum]|uniref:uncharacterized protein LOC113311074 n=1 Tax=Papaver somniferum TaxID=3469 RepID=UPI000E70511C|nr:uncharacterized protein LOC113311074 [Papaver somniferum]